MSEEKVMDFLVMNGFDVRPGQNEEFQQWVRQNVEALSNNAPEGIELLGIYSAIFSSEKHSGQYRTVWRMDSYGAMDKFAAAAGEDSAFARLLEEMGSFGDVRIGADFSNELLKSVVDITIWADKPEE